MRVSGGWWAGLKFELIPACLVSTIGVIIAEVRYEGVGIGKG